MIRSLRTVAACLGVGLLFLAHAMSAAAQETPPAPTVTYPNSTQSSAPLWTAPPARATVAGEVPKTKPIHPLPQGEPVPGGEHANDHALQNKAGQHLSVEQGPAFQGIIQDGFVPPDANIAVGPSNIVQVVNSEIAIIDKSSGAMEPGYPKQLSSLWAGLTGACAQSNSGDPVVQYDRLADRWIVTQLASLKSPYAECIAVSKTSDPSKEYYLYSYSFGSNLNDYPKFSVWPTATNSAYFATYNLFANGASFIGADLCAYDREAMLNGDPAPAQICFQVSDGGVLPSDLDGSTPPNSGEPGYFLDFDSPTSLALRMFSPDFTTPKNSKLSAPTELTVASFSEACNGGTCIPQPGTSRKLDSLGDRLMYRLAYRNFGTHESMVVNHSIASGSSVAPRWYLLDASPSTEGQFVIAQQGTYAPDASYRWMGSIAMDQSGDIALGYSVSSSSVYPSIAITGRTSSDPVGDGNMEGETILQAGGGSQTGTTRWGDYSSMRIDPADDCTFWYTNQFYPKTASYNWYTYIGFFKFSSCGGSAGGGGSGDFSLALTGVTSPITLVGGASESSSQVTVTPSGDFTSAVTLSSVCAAPISCSLNPTSVANGASTLTVSVADGAPSGFSAETITGTGGGITHSISFTVKVPAAQFTLTAPSGITVRRGSNASVSITASDVASGTTNSPVSLTIGTSQLPRGVNASLSTNSIGSNGGSAALKITANRNAPSNAPFSVTINGSDVSGSDGISTSVKVSGTIQ